MFGLKIFIIVFLIICVRQVPSVASQRPIISPRDIQYVVTNTSTDITLKYEGNGTKENITWILPDNRGYWTNTNFKRRVLNMNGDKEALPKYLTRTKDDINITYINETDSTDPTKKNAVALLTLKNVTYNDIGFYYCRVVGPHIDNGNKTIIFYVFVKDEQRLAFLAKDKTYIINERKTNQNVTFPCIPTTPYITVVLKASSSRSSDNYTEVSSKIATYNYHLGYTLNISETNFDKFICEFRDNKIIEQIYFTVRFDNFDDYNIKPYINYTGDYINAYSGDDLKLTCTIVTNFENTSSIVWVIPNKSHVNNVQIKNRTIPMFNYGRLHVLTLHIKGLSASNAGEYICKANNTENEGSVANKFVTMDLDKMHVKPEINANSVHTINSGENLTLSCTGQENIFWSLPPYTETNSQVELNNTKIPTYNSTLKYVNYLRIINASYYDTGYYYCYGNNSQKNDPKFSSKVFVYVQDDGHLNSNPTGAFSIKTAQYSKLMIPCIPTSPDIKVSLIDTISLQERPEKYIPFEGFSLYVPVDDIIENLECKFERGNRTEIQTNVIDVERTYKYEYMPFLSTTDKVYIVTGDDLILYCSVLVEPDFYPDISWATPNQPKILTNRIINTSEISYMVSNGKLVVNTLTISDVTLEDNREYECSILDNSNKTRYNRKIVDNINVNNTRIGVIIFFVVEFVILIIVGGFCIYCGNRKKLSDSPNLNTTC